MDGSDLEIEVTGADTTVLSLKQKVASVLQVDPGRLRLISTGRVLQDAHLLSQYSVSEGTVLHAVVRPAGAQPSSTQSSSANSQGSSSRSRTASGSNSQNPIINFQQVGPGVVMGSISISSDSSDPDINDFLNQILGGMSASGPQLSSSSGSGSESRSNTSSQSENRSSHGSRSSSSLPPVSNTASSSAAQLTPQSSVQSTQPVPAPTRQNRLLGR